MNYTLTVTERQAEIIAQACEILARLRMGQFDSIHYLAVPDMPTEYMPEFREHARALEELLRPMTQVPRDEAWVRETAWDVYQVVRYRLAHDRLGDGEKPGPYVRYHAPMLTGTEPLARMEATRDDA